MSPGGTALGYPPDVPLVDVVLPIPIDRPFTYRVPEGTPVEPGTRVVVPFRQRTMTGYVSGLRDREPPFPVRDVVEVRDHVLSGRLLELTRWVADTYLCSWGEALNAAIPAAIRRRRASGTIAMATLAPHVSGEPRGERQRALVEVLKAAREPLPVRELLEKAEARHGALAPLVRAGVIRISRVPAGDVDAMADLLVEPAREIEPTPEQRAALAVIDEATAGRPSTVLLHGVTGSGKTEVYLRAIAKTVAAGRQAIVLVPEIALTPQTVARFKSRFRRVAVLHSVLSEADRAAQWRSIRAGEMDVVVGARSAVFAPTRALGLVIIDEEHEHAYKQENDPRYHARDVAIRRAELEGAAVVLGSATPSLESLYHARMGHYRLARLPYRIERREMPAIRVVDMAAERLATKRYPVISRALERDLKAAIGRGEQVILFLNRRGYLTYVACRRCGWIFRCSRCDVGMTYHKDRDRSECHQCFAGRELPDACPECRTDTLMRLGMGTEKIEEEIRTRFPELGVRRMDSDAMKTRRDYREALSELRGGDADVVVGTQMIAKGLDVPNVTVVGVVSADTAFHLPDFRAAERTFQLITQVAGRAGRGPKGGTVVVQTFNPTHYAIRAAAAYDFDGFVTRELESRKELGYPPFSRLVRIVATGANEEKVRKAAKDLADRLRAELPPLLVSVLGPAPAAITRIKGRFRMSLLLKATDPEPARAVLRKLLPSLSRSKGVAIAADVDPVAMM